MAGHGRHGELQSLADHQWTVLKSGQIRDLGVTRHQVDGLLADGILHSRFKGIYTYATNRPPPKGVLLAAQWSCGDDAYLTGRTALAIAKLRGLHLGRIEVAVPQRTVRSRQPPIAVQRVRTAPEKLRRDGPLRYATVPRALFDMASAGAEVRELRRLITEAIHHQRLDHHEMRALLETEAGRPGVRNLRAAYASYLPRKSARSGLERSYDRGLETRPDIPDPERNVYVEAGGIRWELDRYWPEARVAVELRGGGWHDTDETREKDEFKAAKLAIIGIQIIYVSDRRWELEPGTCLSDLAGVLAQRRARRVA